MLLHRKNMNRLCSSWLLQNANIPILPIGIRPFKLIYLFRITGAWQNLSVSQRKKKEIARKKHVFRYLNFVCLNLPGIKEIGTKLKILPLGRGLNILVFFGSILDFRLQTQPIWDFSMYFYPVNLLGLDMSLTGECKLSTCTTQHLTVHGWRIFTYI